MNIDSEIIRLKSDLRSLETKMNEKKNEIESAKKKIKDLESKYKAAKEFTKKLLVNCSRKGITKVAINKKSKKVPASVDWPFSYIHNDIFTFIPKKNRIEGFPPIWEIVDKMGISGGCGNGDQHSLSEEGSERLIDGVYEVRKGKWKKIK